MAVIFQWIGICRAKRRRAKVQDVAVWAENWWRIHGSAAKAKVRLKKVIAADRRNVPCGRWVRTGVYWVGYAKTGWISKIIPRYRYVVRR